jgi:hypothetical protein
MTVVVLLLAAVWTLAVLAVLTLVWAHGARQTRTRETFTADGEDTEPPR